MLRVRTGPECPEDNRRELLSVTNLNCGIAKEREKINRPEHTVGRSQDKGTKQVQRRARRLWTGPALPEAGGRGEGKGVGSAPRTAAPTALQTGLQFLIKDLLRFWKVDICREGHGETQGAGVGGYWGWGRGEQKARHTRGECAQSSFWLPEPL